MRVRPWGVLPRRCPALLLLQPSLPSGRCKADHQKVFFQVLETNVIKFPFQSYLLSRHNSSAVELCGAFTASRSINTFRQEDIINHSPLGSVVECVTRITSDDKVVSS